VITASAVRAPCCSTAGGCSPASPSVDADVGDLRAHRLDRPDPHVNPMGAKDIGEIGILGTAAAVSNAVHHATGIRVRDLPITLDKVLAGLP
jgi:xanthine dehydrogenase YagR molybdenum-binding subunit